MWANKSSLANLVYSGPDLYRDSNIQLKIAVN